MSTLGYRCQYQPPQRVAFVPESRRSEAITRWSARGMAGPTSTPSGYVIRGIGAAR